MVTIRALFLFLASVLMSMTTGAAMAQGFGEQAPLQFKYANQGFTNAVYALQLGAAAAQAAAAGSASSGGSGSAGAAGQASSQLSNVIQVYNNQTYNVTGSNNYLNIEGTAVNGTQSSSGSSQSSSNARANEISVTNPPAPAGSQYLNP